jgi:hypothetical protein
LDKDGLLDDMVFKGQEELVIQDLLILTNISPGNGQAVTHFFTRKKATFTGAILPGATMFKSITPVGAAMTATSIAGC